MSSLSRGALWNLKNTNILILSCSIHNGWRADMHNEIYKRHFLLQLADQLGWLQAYAVFSAWLVVVCRWGWDLVPFYNFCSFPFVACRSWLCCRPVCRLMVQVKAVGWWSCLLSWPAMLDQPLRGDRCSPCFLFNLPCCSIGAWLGCLCSFVELTHSLDGGCEPLGMGPQDPINNFLQYCLYQLYIMLCFLWCMSRLLVRQLGSF